MLCYITSFRIKFLSWAWLTPKSFLTYPSPESNQMWRKKAKFAQNKVWRNILNRKKPTKKSCLTKGRFQKKKGKQLVEFSTKMGGGGSADFSLRKTQAKNTGNGLKSILSQTYLFNFQGGGGILTRTEFCSFETLSRDHLATSRTRIILNLFHDMQIIFSQ